MLEKIKAFFVGIWTWIKEVWGKFVAWVKETFQKVKVWFLGN
jgi:hypothetical protein